MAAPTCNSSASVGSASGPPEASGEATLPPKAVDAAKLNRLLDFVRERLTTDVYGNFNIQGDRLAKDGRHTKLREVVELNGLLQDVKGLLERKNETLGMETPHEGRKTGKPSGKELEKGLRDIKLENERLRDRASKAEERMKKAEADHDALRENVRKLSSGQMRGVRSIVKEEAGRTVREIFDQTKVKERLTDTEKIVKRAAIDTEAQICAVEETLIKRVSDGTRNGDRHIDGCVLNAIGDVNRVMACLRQDYENDKEKLSTEVLQ